MTWVVDAYALPFRLFTEGSPWAPATVEVWSDRVVVQVVAPLTVPAVASLPWAPITLESGWTLHFASGAATAMWSGRGDDSEGTARCYLLFGGRRPDDRPVSLTGWLDGVAVAADVSRPVSA